MFTASINSCAVRNFRFPKLVHVSEVRALFLHKYVVRFKPFLAIIIYFIIEDWASYTWSVEPPDLDLFTVSGDTDFIQLKVRNLVH